MTDDRLPTSRRRYLLGLGAGAFGATGVGTAANSQTTAPGEELWAFETGERIFSSPTVVDGTVHVGSSDGNLYAVDATTGSHRGQPLRSQHLTGRA